MLQFWYLSSKDALTLHPNNSTYDFTVELLETIKGKFSCALVDFSCAGAITEELYIFSDILENSSVHDHALPLLRIVSQTGEVRLPHYKPLSRQVIQRVRIYIRTKEFKVPSSDIGPVRCVLSVLPLK